MFLGAFVGLNELVERGWLEARAGFAPWSLLLLAYLLFEVQRERAKRQPTWLATPALLASLVMFGIEFGITNAPLNSLERSNTGPLFSAVGYMWLDRAMLLAALAAWCMWRGYRCSVGRVAGERLRRSAMLSTVRRRELELRWSAVVVMVVLSAAARVAEIRLGVFGYSGGLSQFSKWASYTQWLTLLASLGTIALAAVSLVAASKRATTKLPAAAAVLLLSSEVAWGFLSGMKSKVVMPFLVVAACYYLMGRRVPKLLILAVPVAIVVAYAVIEPFRVLRYEDPSFSGRDPVEIARSVVKSARAGGGLARARPGFVGTGRALVERLNMTGRAARAVEFADTQPVGNARPQFLRDVLLSPAYAVIPRVLWTSKPEETLGAWFNQRVLESKSRNTSVAMSAVGYLYFAGGIAGVVLGFMLFGVVQRTLWVWLATAGAGGLLVFVGVLEPLVSPGSAVDSVVISVVRAVPLLLVVQALVFRQRTAKRRDHESVAAP